MSVVTSEMHARVIHFSKLISSGLGLSNTLHCGGKNCNILILLPQENNTSPKAQTNCGSKLQSYFKCLECGRCFNKARGLKRHMYTHKSKQTHSIQQKPTSTTEIRQSQHATSTHCSGLTNHKSIHTKEKQYQCPTCMAQFAQSGSLKVHMRIHTGEKPFSCDVCDAQFNQSGNLIAHKRVHTGEKPFKCENCHARFAHASGLRQHKRTHTGEKPYWCKTCGATFTQSSSLRVHEQSHEGNVFQCKECNAQYNHKGSLKVHILRSHRK